MTRVGLLILAFAAIGLSCLGQAAPASQTQTDASGKSADPTQSFVSPLTLGTGATLAVTQKGTSVTAALASQTSNPVINFWQIGFSGTTNTSGQAEVYSTHESDAPGFQAKVGLGKSSMIKVRTTFTRTSAEFLSQVWCRDLVAQVDKSLPVDGRTNLAATTPCKDAVAAEQKALTAKPPLDEKGQPDAKTAALDQSVLLELERVAGNITPFNENDVCLKLKSDADFVQFCPGGKLHKDLTDARKAYPGFDTFTEDAPAKFQWGAWGNWIPVVTSTPYRPVVNGVADLSSKQNWTGLTNTGVGDLAVYYGNLSFGLEGGYGQTVQIKQQNVCLNTVSGSYSAQQCSMAMVGKPTPKNSWISSSTLQITPLPIFGENSALTGGAQVLFSYTAPSSGGHMSELAVPFYISPSLTRMSFVVGIKPTWDWNTDPTVGNKFSIAVFAGVRPSITKN